MFQPTAELARSHIAASVDAVLRHPPTPGRRTVDRFKTEIGSHAWPESPDDLRTYLREQYFGRVRESAQRQLAQLIVKCCILIPVDAPNRELLVARYPAAASALLDVSPPTLERALDSVVRRKEQLGGLTDDEIRGAVGTLGSLSAFWAALPEASVPRGLPPVWLTLGVCSNQAACAVA